MAIRLDEARLRLLKMYGELFPSTNNTYNVGTSSLKFANMYATTFHGALNGNANTATALTSSAGSTTQPIYFSNGKPVAITGAIANNISGNAATATALQSSAGSTTQPIYFKDGKPVAVILKDTCNNLLNALDTDSSTPVDADYYISQYANGGTTTTTYHRRPVNALYSYIKGKAEGNWNINAKTATEAEKDAAGHTIHTTYLKREGGTITGPIFYGNSGLYYTSHAGFQQIRSVYLVIDKNYLSSSNVYSCVEEKFTTDFGSNSYIDIYPAGNHAYLYLGKTFIRQTYATAGDTTSSSTDETYVSYTALAVRGIDSTKKELSPYYNIFRVPPNWGDDTTNRYYYFLTSKQISISATNRLLYTSSTSYGGSLSTSNHYASSTKIAINSTSNPSYNLYVHGSTGLNGNLKVSGAVTVTGSLTADSVHGAVWNDYAEYRSAETIKPGTVVREDKNGIMKITTERLMPACEIISDTFGFAIGETDECKTPIAATGRVLAYPYEDRYSFELGDAVCSGPNGTVSKMTREELMMYPERMIGTVSEIPEYKTWGSGNVEVDGRIWIRVR